MFALGVVHVKLICWCDGVYGEVRFLSFTGSGDLYSLAGLQVNIWR